MRITIYALAALFTALPFSLQAQQPPGDRPPSLADAFMNSLDTDKNGKVDKAEFLKPYEAQFRSMDRNGDGVIDRSEIEAVEQQVRRRMEQSHRQQGGGR